MGTIRVAGEGSEHSAAFGDLSDGRTQHRRLLAVPLSTAGRRRSRAGRPAPELRSPPGQQLRRPLAGPPAAPPESRPLPPWASYWTLSPRPGSAPRICFQRGLGPRPPCRLQPEPAPHGWVCSGVGSGLPGHPRLLRPPRCQARPICRFLLSVTYEAVTPPSFRTKERRCRVQPASRGVTAPKRREHRAAPRVPPVAADAPGREALPLLMCRRGPPGGVGDGGPPRTGLPTERPARHLGRPRRQVPGLGLGLGRPSVPCGCCAGGSGVPLCLHVSTWPHHLSPTGHWGEGHAACPRHCGRPAAPHVGTVRVRRWTSVGGRPRPRQSRPDWSPRQLPSIMPGRRPAGC